VWWTGRPSGRWIGRSPTAGERLGWQCSGRGGRWRQSSKSSKHAKELNAEGWRSAAAYWAPTKPLKGRPWSGREHGLRWSVQVPNGLRRQRGHRGATAGERPGRPIEDIFEWPLHTAHPPAPRPWCLKSGSAAGVSVFCPASDVPHDGAGPSAQDHKRTVKEDYGVRSTADIGRLCPAPLLRCRWPLERVRYSWCSSRVSLSLESRSAASIANYRARRHLLPG